ncbi:unnamed protein product [Periconia digitata]|uniref:Jacalin-type lectin domain-containing protein n=1 Tax=Periconia digitata TaxID=1303443 RepID=A0A9W4UL98_9PLEO|nr:unnamed protein product [Periconia digitata]
MRFLLFASTVALSLFGSVIAGNDGCGSGKEMMIDAPVGKPLGQNRESDKFCDARWQDGNVITGIRVWWMKFQIKAVQFRFAGNDWGDVHGDNSDSSDEQYKEKTWGEDDTIEMELWNNKPDDGDPMDAVGKIRITQSGKEDFNAGGSKIASDSMKINTGSGKLLAVMGAAAADGHVSSLVFHFLKSSIKSMQITKIDLKNDFDEWAKDKKNGPQRVRKDEQWHVNMEPLGSANDKITLEQVSSTSQSKTLTRSSTRTFGYHMDVSIEAGIEFEGIGGIKTTMSTGFEESESSTTTESNTEGSEDGVKRTTTVEVAPQKARLCTLTDEGGQFDSPYTATIKATLENGKYFEYKSGGEYVSVQWSKGVSRCEASVPLKEAPKSALEQKPKKSYRLARFISAA